MSRALFLSRLKDGLSGMAPEERREIMADYEAHFSDAAAAGRSDADVESALGDPARLAKELRAEASLKHWEEKRSPRNYMRAGSALLGLATIDFLILLPLGFIFVILIGALLYAFWLAGGIGLSLALSVFRGAGNGFAAGAPLAFAGLGVLCGAVGAGALILMVLGWALRLLGNYARLHYRLLKNRNEE